MTGSQERLQHQASIEALRNQLHNLEETIGSPLELMKEMPEGE